MSAQPCNCRKCGIPVKDDKKAFHPECWAKIKEGIGTIPPIYRSLRPLRCPHFAESKPFVVLLGECGTGKSVTAAELLERTARKTGKIPEWKNCAELMLEIRATFDQRSKETEAEIVKRLCRFPLLCVDDLAAEKVSDFSVSTLYIIINRRGEYDLPTIITSNLTLPQISEQLGDRIANRLARYGSVITLAKRNVKEPHDP